MSKILTFRVKEHVPNSHFQGSRMFKICSFRKKNVPNSHSQGWRKFKIFTFRVEECSRFSHLQGWSVQDSHFQDPRIFKILTSRVQKCSRFSLSGSKNVQDSHFQPGRRMFGQNSVFQGRNFCWDLKVSCNGKSSVQVACMWGKSLLLARQVGIKQLRFSLPRIFNWRNFKLKNWKIKWFPRFSIAKNERGNFFIIIRLL